MSRDQIVGTSVPIWTWLPADEIEAAARQQLVTASGHPDVALRLAVLPDCHVGFGVTIGCVMPTDNAVIPNAVGVDIGCGMCAIDSGVTLNEVMDRTFWQAWGGSVSRNVPTGFQAHRAPMALGPLDRALRARALQPLVQGKAALQIGTLGGGNHFLEAQVDERGHVWFMVHSGSRHVGLRIASHYHGMAGDLAARRGINMPKDLAALPLDDDTGQDYVHDMTWATDYALESRLRMVREMLEAFWRQLELAGIPFEPVDLTTVINIHHNDARLEVHEGMEVMVHRKGATSAREGETGIIPGSMGAPSYIVRGRGNPESLMSCSHGAGRVMSRRNARKLITREALAASLTGTFTMPSPGVIDEAPDAYKDISVVIDRQRDLIDVLHPLRPILTIKGDSRARDD